VSADRANGPTETPDILLRFPAFKDYLSATRHSFHVVRIFEFGALLLIRERLEQIRKAVAATNNAVIVNSAAAAEARLSGFPNGG
jgi:hypothetical protein